MLEVLCLLGDKEDTTLSPRRQGSGQKEAPFRGLVVIHRLLRRRSLLLRLLPFRLPPWS